MESKTNALPGEKLVRAAVVGLVPACIETILIYFADPAADKWIFIQSALFWFSCGAVVYLANTSSKKILFSVLLTIFLNAPWYIALTVVANQPSHLVPLVVASIIMGLVIGLISKWLEIRQAGIAPEG